MRNTRFGVGYKQAANEAISGEAPGAGDQDCAPHSGDYAPQDWQIALPELMRMIQIYNSAGYHACEGGEDGFCLDS